MGRFLAIASLTVLATLAFLPVTSANVCTSAAGCEFWDNNYHQYILYDVDTTQVDVLIVPPASGLPLMDLAAIQQSVAAWKAGIQASAPSWLANGLHINAYTLGIDSPPQSALSDPEIIIATANHDPFVLFGIGEQVPFSVCRQQAAADHVHAGAILKMMSCSDGGVQCIVLNTNWLLGTAHEMYDLNAHEFGHCLGIGHVGDALDFDAKTVPLQDIMSYATTPSQVHCVSSLDIVGLEHVYAGLLGQPGYLPAGSFFSYSPASYTQVSCANPSENILGAAAVQVAPPIQSSLPTPAALPTWDPVALLQASPVGGMLR